MITTNELAENTVAVVLAGGRGHGSARLTARHSRCLHDGMDRTSLVAEDCVVAGTVRRSVLFSDVQVSRGALVENAVILPGAVIGRDCRLRGVIVDSECRVPDGTVIDHAWRDRASYQPRQPVVVTTEDFAPELVSSCA